MLAPGDKAVPNHLSDLGYVDSAIRIIVDLQWDQFKSDGMSHSEKL